MFARMCRVAVHSVVNMTWADTWSAFTATNQWVPRTTLGRRGNQSGSRKAQEPGVIPAARVSSAGRSRANATTSSRYQGLNYALLCVGRFALFFMLHYRTAPLQACATLSVARRS